MLFIIFKIYIDIVRDVVLYGIMVECVNIIVRLLEWRVVSRVNEKVSEVKPINKNKYNNIIRLVKQNHYKKKS